MSSDEQVDAWGSEWPGEVWAVARALARITSLDADQLCPEAAEAIQALDEHREAAS